MVLASAAMILRAQESRRFRANLDEARRDLDAGRFHLARKGLARLSAWRPNHAEVEYLSGACEQATGHLDAALTAWERVPSGTAFTAAARLAAARAMMLERGRFTLAETTLRSAIREKEPAAFEARQMLAWLLLWQGRTDEARPLLEDGWDDAPNQPPCCASSGRSTGNLSCRSSPSGMGWSGRRGRPPRTIAPGSAAATC